MFRTLSVALFVALTLPWSTAHGAARSELKLWVVEARTEDRDTTHYDKGLEAIHRVLSSLPHDTYRNVSTGIHPLKESGITRIALTSNYTLEMSAPVAGSDGRHRVRLRILTLSKETPAKEIEALSTELLLRPDKQVLVRGLKLKEDRELVLVLSLSVADDAPAGT